jgi:Tfp pilus assembly protein FimT
MFRNIDELVKTENEKFQKGFTIIEILIVFTFIAVLTVLGIAAYSSYTSTQQVQSGAADVATMLNTAKNQSLSQVIPTSCGVTPVTGYRVDITVGGGQFVFSAICGLPQTVTTSNLPPRVTFAAGSTASVFFPISTGMPTTGASITVTGYGKSKVISVSQTGAIAVN